MGCWNETCMLSRLPILIGDKAIAVLLTQEHNHPSPCNPDGTFAPLSFPIHGHYDDYGRLEDIKRNADMLDMLAAVTFFVKTSDGMAPPAYLTPGWQDGDGWESAVISLLDDAQQCRLYIRDPRMASGFTHVRLALMREDMFDFAVKSAAAHYDAAEYTDRLMYLLTARVVKTDPNRAANAYLPVTKPAAGRPAPCAVEMARLTLFMNGARIAWGPTCGSGSQSCLDRPDYVKFYKTMADKAAELHRYYHN